LNKLLCSREIGLRPMLGRRLLGEKKAREKPQPARKGRRGDRCDGREYNSLMLRAALPRDAFRAGLRFLGRAYDPQAAIVFLVER
jgi:hypothetical protein